MADLRDKHSRDFKEQAVRIVDEGRKSGQETEVELGIGTGQVVR